MAKKARKAKAATKKKSAKASAKKAGKKSAVKKKASAKKVAKKSRTQSRTTGTAAMAKAAPAPGLARGGAVLSDPKNGAINTCVNNLMDAARPGWSDNGKMDTDYQYNKHSIRAFLSTIQGCLQGKHYTLDMTDDDFVTACLSAAVYQLKSLIYDKTT